MCCDCEHTDKRICEDYSEDKDKMALYTSLNDIYKIRFPWRRKLLSILISHLLKTFKTDPTIFMIMDIMKEIKIK